jgi:hypothetical protein
MQAGASEFLEKTDLVSTLKQTRTQCRVDVHCGGDDLFRDVSVQHGKFRSVSSVSSVVEYFDKQMAVRTL